MKRFGAGAAEGGDAREVPRWWRGRAPLVSFVEVGLGDWLSRGIYTTNQNSPRHPKKATASPPRGGRPGLCRGPAGGPSPLSGTATPVPAGRGGGSTGGLERGPWPGRAWPRRGCPGWPVRRAPGPPRLPGLSSRSPGVFRPGGAGAPFPCVTLAAGRPPPPYRARRGCVPPGGDRPRTRTHRRACSSRRCQALARYWATDYDWRKVEARLNALPQFITEIDGVDIHFIHVRSRHRTPCRSSSPTAGPARSSSS